MQKTQLSTSNNNTRHVQGQNNSHKAKIIRHTETTKQPGHVTTHTFEVLDLKKKSIGVSYMIFLRQKLQKHKPQTIPVLTSDISHSQTSEDKEKGKATDGQSTTQRNYTQDM